MKPRSFLLATALLAASATAAWAQDADDVIAAPALRASVNVAGEVVRIGDLVDNAGTAAQIAIYRAPDLGTTGSLPIAQVVAPTSVSRSYWTRWSTASPATRSSPSSSSRLARRSSRRWTTGLIGEDEALVQSANTARSTP